MYSTCCKHLVQRLSFQGTSQEKRTSLLNPRIRFLHLPTHNLSLHYVHPLPLSNLKLCTRKYVLPLHSPLPLYLPHHCHEKSWHPPNAQKKVIVINRHHKHRFWFAMPLFISIIFVSESSPNSPFPSLKKKTKAGLNPHRRTECKPSARRRKWKGCNNAARK